MAQGFSGPTHSVSYERQGTLRMAWVLELVAVRNSEGEKARRAHPERRGRGPTRVGIERRARTARAPRRPVFRIALRKGKCRIVHDSVSGADFVSSVIARKGLRKEVYQHGFRTNARTLGECTKIESSFSFSLWSVHGSLRGWSRRRSAPDAERNFDGGDETRSFG